ncbi:MAG: hypothetical protein PF488_02170 [Patescibacteria group bacterium]|jgi:hypothetical protein|nr:hypothetical protein [Patescibacteria group bacterium]
MKTIEIKSTFKGMYASLLNSLIWVIIPIFGALSLNWCCDYFKWSEISYDYDLVVVLMVIGYIIMAFIAIWSLYNLLITAFYGPTNTMVFYLDDHGKITKISDTYYGFVNTKQHEEIVCNRILSVGVYTPTIGPIFNTGTLTINFVSFANADYVEKSWIISGVKFPEYLKEKIIQASPLHEGLKIV